MSNQEVQREALSFIETTDKYTGKTSRRPWTTTVFHITQTEAQPADPQIRATFDNEQPEPPAAAPNGRLAF